MHKIQKEKYMSYFENCLYFSSNQLARHLNKIAEAAFNELNITPTQGFTLIVVGELDIHAPTEIAKALEMKPSTITRFLDKLETLQYVERTYTGRSTDVQLTSMGAHMLPAIQEAWCNIDSTIKEVFTETLSKDLTKKLIIANSIFNA